MVGARRPLFIHRTARTPEPADEGAETAHVPIVAPPDAVVAAPFERGTGAEREARPCAIPGIVRTRALVCRRWATLPSVVFAFYLVLLLAVVALVVLLVRGTGRAVGRAIRDDQMGRGAKARLLASVLAAALVVGFVAWLAAFLRDPVVTVRGTDYFCSSAPIGEDPFPADVQEQCDAQGHDRRMQALASGAAASGAAAVVMLLAVRIAQQRSPT